MMYDIGVKAGGGHGRFHYIYIAYYDGILVQLYDLISPVVR